MTAGLVWLLVDPTAPEDPGLPRGQTAQRTVLVLTPILRASRKAVAAHLDSFIELNAHHIVASRTRVFRGASETDAARPSGCAGRRQVGFGEQYAAEG